MEPSCAVEAVTSVDSRSNVLGCSHTMAYSNQKNLCYRGCNARSIHGHHSTQYSCLVCMSCNSIGVGAFFLHCRTCLIGKGGHYSHTQILAKIFIFINHD